MTTEQAKLKGSVYSTSGPGVHIGTSMVYCERDSADSYYLALTIGKQYIVTSLFSRVDGVVGITGSCYLQDDNVKGINLLTSNFCSIEEWRDKQINKII